jgi:hypothetical protein
VDVMDKNYIKEHTRNWVLDEEQPNGLKLYRYFDSVEWEDKWAIEDKDENIIYCWSNGEHGNNNSFFEAIVEIYSKIKL